MRSWLMIGWILQCLKQENEVQHWRTDLLEMEKCTKNFFSIENRGEQKMESSIARIRWDPTTFKGAQSVFLLGFLPFFLARRGNIEMVNLIGMFALLLKRFKIAWMERLPISAKSQEQRETQCCADVDQLDEGRRGRGLIALDPTSEATRDHWHTTQVANHGRLFPICDNLTTLVFSVAGDLNEAQRESLTRTHSLRGMSVPAYTLEAVKTVFMDLICTPKSSMENPLLRVSRHGGSTGRTFIVEDYAEDEYGQWDTDAVTREQGYIEDERLCFWDMGCRRVCVTCRKFTDRQLKRRSVKGRGTGKGKGGFKRKGRACLGEEQAQDLEWHCEEGGAWWSKGRRGTKGSSIGKNRLSDDGFRTYQSEKNAGSDNNGHKGKGKERKGKGKECAHPQSCFFNLESSQRRKE